MAVDYEAKRLAAKNEEAAELSENEKTYGGMIADSDEYYQGLIDESKKWADKQTELQQEKSDFAIQKIEQQQEQTKKDYIKEQAGAYADWQKQSNPYGVNAEQMAAQGLTGTGYSETSQVRMYTAYQNRVALARESYQLAVQNYNNSINEARMQNDSILAEIAYNSLQKQLELSLKGFQYKNELILEQAAKKTAIKNKYQEIYDKIDEAQPKYTITGSGSSGSGSSGSSSKPTVNGNIAGGTRSAAIPTTYEAAHKYLKENGVTDYNLMTKSVWARRKSAYNRTGIGGIQVSANATYADYLRTAVQHALSQKNSDSKSTSGTSNPLGLSKEDVLAMNLGGYYTPLKI